MERNDSIKFKMVLSLLIISLICNYYLYKETKNRAYDLVGSEFEDFYLSVSNTLAILEDKYEKPVTMVLFDYQANPPFRSYKHLNIGSSTEYVIKEYENILKDLNNDKYKENHKLIENFNRVFELLTPLAGNNELNMQQVEIVMKKIKPLIDEITLLP